jgi:predicted ATPase/class 3 adenylate cyclase
MHCETCGTDNTIGAKFCSECGAALEQACPSCSTAAPAGAKYCAQCGHGLGRETPSTAAPVSERRLVSVLFADLVGFTTASEGRDAEETRELLTRYFDSCRRVIERYGGTIEKFIGDAVMAVWGAPVANEDDAERAVRAALELVAAVPGLDPALRARAGVLTGEAAVTLGATDQGIVAGDLVNSASRIQSAASPGTVLVGEATKRATDAAVVYTDSGEHELKGKAVPTRLWQAERIVAARKGEGRAAGLEAPFVGRDRELRLVKDVFHATSDQGRAHLLSVVGVAGIGKSRLAWEFEKYIDGLAHDAWWHKGRCLAYGEGVAYWALAEMIRMRARIAEDEPRDDALAKLALVLDELVPDPTDRVFVEPRLQHLLGLTDRIATDRQDLFSGWRLFIERMAEQHPVIMVFEDIQWADASLIEFLEYLLEWSRGFPLFVLTLARPEVVDRHPAWGAGMRSFTSVQLEPLAGEAIDLLLRGLVPGLPDEALAKIRDRADGIPLYAVETVRMLLDRGLLEPGANGYQVAGELTSLDVPETLHALIASRLDGLPTAERLCLQDASVLGKTFSARGIAAISGGAEPSELLSSLARKELLVLDTDPRSPERGQYGFLQALVQRVAYDTLSRHDRKAKHLAAARYLADEAGIDPDEIAEVIAAHYVDAARADETAADAPDITAHARSWLERAGERAASLAAADEAQRAFENAAGLADTPVGKAQLLERAGHIARQGARLNESERLLAEARRLYVDAGDMHAAARAAAGVARAMSALGRTDEAVSLGEEAYAVLTGDEPDSGTATLAAELARIHHFSGNEGLALERVETALDIAERLQLPQVLAGALNTKALTVGLRHPTEAYALLRGALDVALQHDLAYEALRAYNNLIVSLDALDRLDETLPLAEEAYEVARRYGDRDWQERLGAGLADEYAISGRWDDALGLSDEIRPAVTDAYTAMTYLIPADIHWFRGHDETARALLDAAASMRDDPTNSTWRTARHAIDARIARLDGDAASALAASEAYLAESVEHRAADTNIGEGLRLVANSVLAAADPEPAQRALARAAEALAVRATRPVTGAYERLAGVLAANEGLWDEAIGRYAAALPPLRSFGDPIWLAELLLDYADALCADDRAAEAAPLAAEAREILERLGAVRLIAAVEALEDRIPLQATA